MAFIASWYCGMFGFFSFFNPASLEQPLACEQPLPGVSINSPWFQLFPVKVLFSWFNYVSSEVCMNFFLVLS